MEQMEITERQQAVFLLGMYSDLQRIKSAQDREKEIEYQLRTMKTKLEILGIAVDNLKIE